MLIAIVFLLRTGDRMKNQLKLAVCENPRQEKFGKIPRFFNCRRLGIAGKEIKIALIPRYYQVSSNNLLRDD